MEKAIVPIVIKQSDKHACLSSRKMRRHRTKTVHVPRSPKITNNTTNNKWIKLLGDKTITDVFVTECGATLVSNERDPTGQEEFFYGLVSQERIIEWGLVNVSHLRQFVESGEAEARYYEKLPCTLEVLFDTTPIGSYFIE